MPTLPVSVTFEEKKSLFHAHAALAETRDMAMQVLATQQEQYPDARHHCWAYLLGAPEKPLSLASNDDGEPSGTAGKPMLNVLQHNDIGDVMVVISRYFGGIKLGAGGLVRAYSRATAMALEQLQTHTFIPRIPIHLTVSFKDEQFVRHIVEQHQGNIDACQYNDTVLLSVSVPKVTAVAFKQHIQMVTINDESK